MAYMCKAAISNKEKANIVDLKMIATTHIFGVGKYDVSFFMHISYKWYYMEWKYGGGEFPHPYGMTLRSCRKLSFVGIWVSKAPHHTYFCFWKPIADQLRYTICHSHSSNGCQ